MAIAEVIKFEGPQDAIVWKFPIEDFNATSQLVVDETHEALLVVNGNVADLFTAGCRTLSAMNIPIVRSLLETPNENDSPFQCKIFFINKVYAMDLLWKTHAPIALEDPLYGIFMHIIAKGKVSASVDDVRIFISKIVEYNEIFSHADLGDKLNNIVSRYVRDWLSKIMNIGMISYFHINEHLSDINVVVKKGLGKVFEEYGIKIGHFSIESVEAHEKELISHIMQLLKKHDDLYDLQNADYASTDGGSICPKCGKCVPKVKYCFECGHKLG